MVPRIADLEDVPAHPSGRSCLAVEKMSGAPGYCQDNRAHFLCDTPGRHLLVVFMAGNLSIQGS